MTNEEKILAMLTGLTETVSKLSAGQEEMRSDIADLKATHVAMQDTLSEHGAMLKELDERSLRSAVLLEGEIAPKVQTLFEGHKNLQDTLAPIERLEKVEEVIKERVLVLESVVKSHSARIAKLEKAQ